MCNFRRSFDLPLINCEIELDLIESEDFVISEILNNAEVPADTESANPPNFHLPEGFTTNATFEINSPKLYVAEVNLSLCR